MYVKKVSTDRVGTSIVGTNPSSLEVLQTEYWLFSSYMLWRKQKNRSADLEIYNYVSWLS